MKHYIVLITLFLVAITVQAQKSFEGRIVYSVELSGEGAEDMAPFMPENYEFVVKGEKIKFMMKGGMAAAMLGEFISKDNDDKVWMIRHNEKRAYYFPKDEGEEEVDNAEVTKEDEVLTISGYECQKYKIVTSFPNGESVTQYVWTTDKIKFASAKKARRMNTGVFFQKGLEGFPLKVQAGNAEITMIMTATIVDKSKIANSEFEFPDTYEKKEYDPSNPLGGY